MMNPDCDAMRDLLPAYVWRQLPAQDVAMTERHLAGCAPCREEEALLQLLAAPLPVAPAALGDRVLADLRRRGRAWWPASGRLAAAAAAAVLLLGGGALALDVLFPDAGPPQPLATVALEESAAPVSWAVALDPLLAGGPAFEHLSVEELEIILAELDR